MTSIVTLSSSSHSQRASVQHTWTAAHCLHCRCFQTKIYDEYFVCGAWTFWISTTKQQFCLRESTSTFNDHHYTALDALQPPICSGVEKHLLTYLLDAELIARLVS